jgi:hypothetical protein
MASINEVVRVWAAGLYKTRNLSARVAPSFTLGELVRSGHAKKHGIDNFPVDPIIICRLWVVANYVLQPVRQKFGRPMLVSSGYRSPKLNTALKGSTTSQHMRGEAADFVVSGVPDEEVCQWLHEQNRYWQLFEETKVQKGQTTRWVHCSFIVPAFSADATAKKVYKKIFIGEDGKPRYDAPSIKRKE